MQVKKIDNTNFRGFEFKNARVKQIFEEKLNKISSNTAENIKNYIEKNSKENNKIFIDSTYSRMYDTHEYLLFATFSNSNNIVNERCYHTNSLKDFIKKCAAEAGYEPMNNTNKPHK